MMLQHSIIPVIPINHALNNWSIIKEGLMENSRLRRLQIEMLVSEN
jgi:hypothetical protein